MKISNASQNRMLNKFMYFLNTIGQQYLLELFASHQAALKILDFFS